MGHRLIYWDDDEWRVKGKIGGPSVKYRDFGSKYCKDFETICLAICNINGKGHFIIWSEAEAERERKRDAFLTKQRLMGKTGKQTG